MDFDLCSFLDRYAPLSPVPGVEGITIHQTSDAFALWMAWEELTNTMCPVPFWAVAWPAAVLLARYVQKNPALVVGKTVLDLGCGSGLASVACARAGARSVIANDIDTEALEVTALNAKANGVAVVLNENDLLTAPGAIAADVVLVADMFYTRTQAEKLLALLGRVRAAGSMVLIGDGSRNFAPREGLRELARETMPVNRDLEGTAERVVRILEFDDRK
jgi:predicted nicotinamide N-methyase